MEMDKRYLTREESLIYFFNEKIYGLKQRTDTAPRVLCNTCKNALKNFCGIHDKAKT